MADTDYLQQETEKFSASLRNGVLRWQIVASVVIENKKLVCTTI